jgi:hypothetical protein
MTLGPCPRRLPACRRLWPSATRTQEPAITSPVAGSCPSAVRFAAVAVVESTTLEPPPAGSQATGQPAEGLPLILASSCGQWCRSRVAVGHRVATRSASGVPLTGAAGRKTLSLSGEAPKPYDQNRAISFTKTARSFIIRANCVGRLEQLFYASSRAKRMTLSKGKAPGFLMCWRFCSDDLNNLSLRHNTELVQGLTAVKTASSNAIVRRRPLVAVLVIAPARLPGRRPDLCQGGRHPNRSEVVHGLTCTNSIQDETPPGGTGGASTANPARAALVSVSTAGLEPCAQQQASARRPGGRRG